MLTRLLCACALLCSAACSPRLGVGSLANTVVCSLPNDPTPCSDPGGCAPHGAQCGANKTCVCLTPNCTPGQDQTCNSDPTMNALLGHCDAFGACQCLAGSTKSSSTGKCELAESDLGGSNGQAPDLGMGTSDGGAAVVCSLPNDPTPCSDPGGCAPYGAQCGVNNTCACVTPNCTPGQDQSCNNDPMMSALLGHCDVFAACQCLGGSTKNPTTGKCQ